MMRLRYLADNPELAEALLANWRHDIPARQFFADFRVSANAVYPFARDGRRCFLRFCPAAEKSRDSIAAELAFLHHLRAAGFGAAEPIPASSGDEIVVCSTPWGEYLATAFAGAPGRPLGAIPITANIAHAAGANLARLHSLASAYTPVGPHRWTHVDVLDWIDATLSGLSAREPPERTLLLAESARLRRALAQAPTDGHVYGLIHYDYEPDNVFWDAQSRACHVIDFDDAVYHWFAMDVILATDALADSLLEAGSGVDAGLAAFTAGYGSLRPYNEHDGPSPVDLRRFGHLYRYARCARTIDETLFEEPAWMARLRSRLVAAMARDAAALA